MSTVSVLIAATSSDIKADGIAAGILARGDMTLIENRVAPLEQVANTLAALPAHQKVALVLVGPKSTTESLTDALLKARANLVILRVDIVGDEVRLSLRDIGLQSLLSALRELVERVGSSAEERSTSIQVSSTGPDATPKPLMNMLADRPLLLASLNWMHHALRVAVSQLPDENGDLPGAALTKGAVGRMMADLPSEPRASGSGEADFALQKALNQASPRAEPLAAIAQSLRLTHLEFKLLLLVLAPELEPRFQRCMALLQDDASRRGGNVALLASLLGNAPEVRLRLSMSSCGARWRLWDTPAGRVPPADEVMRLDPCLVEWIFGSRTALEQDERISRWTRTTPWAGTMLLDSEEAAAEALETASWMLVSASNRDDPPWVIFTDGLAVHWRAILERGAQLLDVDPIRVDATPVSSAESAEVEDAGCRIGRLARVMGRPLIVDVESVPPQDDERLRSFLEAVGRSAERAGIICSDLTRMARLLGTARFAVVPNDARPGARSLLVQSAAQRLQLHWAQREVDAHALQYPLQEDGLELAVRLASMRIHTKDEPEARRLQFVRSCQDVATEGALRLAHLIEPKVDLESVVLPKDRLDQLQEIVNNVKLAPEVLDGWRFRDQLPYGRGVSCLFHGPSGTGKTMASLAVAKSIGVRVIRVDLSRVLSKFIGDMERNMDRVFLDASQSGAAVLFDEAEALFGKRTEVRDAHDRYANVEVAYLLQRLESFEGLAILTTNLRQNVDAAFLRRLRFVIDFPHPDAKGRERIWKSCLTQQSHELDENAFLMLGRKLDFAGGNIRQITLRAAFAAAAGGSKIKLRHIADASRAEYIKLGLPPVDLKLQAA